MSGFILPLAEGESRPARSAAAGGQFGDFLCKAARGRMSKATEGSVRQLFVAPPIHSSCFLLFSKSEQQTGGGFRPRYRTASQIRERPAAHINAKTHRS